MFEDMVKKAEELLKDQKLADEIWNDSVCSACNKHNCFGTCPEYPEWERNFFKEIKDVKTNATNQ